MEDVELINSIDKENEDSTDTEDEDTEEDGDDKESDKDDDKPQEKVTVQKASPEDLAFDRLLHAEGVNSHVRSVPEYLISTKWINTSELATNELPIAAHYHVSEPVILLLTYRKDMPGKIENAHETGAYLRVKLRGMQVGLGFTLCYCL